MINLTGLIPWFQGENGADGDCTDDDDGGADGDEDDLVDGRQWKLGVISTDHDEAGVTV